MSAASMWAVISAGTHLPPTISRPASALASRIPACGISYFECKLRAGIGGNQVCVRRGSAWACDGNLGQALARLVCPFATHLACLLQHCQVAGQIGFALAWPCLLQLLTTVTGTRPNTFT